MEKPKRNIRHIATLSLMIMAAGFLVTIPLEPSLWKTILQGGFEAGLVGGLADWFAVTALFRHPLGVPIPHTALLPKNRTKITNKIISMIENDWLTKESITAKIHSLQLTNKIFSLIEREIHSEAIKNNIIHLIQYFIKTIEIKKYTPMIENAVKTRLKEIEIKNYLPKLIDQVSLQKYDEKTLDFILMEIDEWAKRDTTKYRLGTIAVEMIDNIKADGFMQFALRSFSNLVNEEKLGSIIQSLIVKGVDSFRDPYNQNRQTLLDHIHQKLQDLKSDEKLYHELEHFRMQIIDSWQPEEKIIELLTEVQQKAIDYILAPDFYVHQVLPFIIENLDKIKADEEKVNQLEAWMKKHIAIFVDQNHAKIGTLVRENLDKLDTETLTVMIETNVGKDLQWIRVNGAVCGFLIGLVLVGIKSLF
ncbi:DUF445 domain-containing protein [Bacillus rubiinfantis]|uniref:DUF445 domain-containing protein n=1 Tax=Bacillus rubiinfantis TaxID=1499680 RepID=UPI0005A66028|nr:DUF445 domain-containing protein [Bacillus rubiinfantis]